MLTTTIGAFPKPAYVPISDWFASAGGDLTSAYRGELERAGDGAGELFDRATSDVVMAQVAAGIDIWPGIIRSRRRRPSGASTGSAAASTVSPPMCVASCTSVAGYPNHIDEEG